MQYLERFSRAKAAMGPSYEIVNCVCLQEQSLKEYALRWRINPAAASGRLFASLERLIEWYESIDGSAAEEKQRATINTGQYNEPASPPSAARWAAD